MLFGDDTTEANSIRICHKAMDSGINFFDTADIYVRGVSETIVGKALKEDGRRDRVFLATKFFNQMDQEDPNSGGSHRYHIIKACEDSLKRLKTDHIDLYQVHRPKSSIPIDETLRALDDLVRQGKVRYIGTSTYAAWQVVESLWASKELGLNRFVTEQPPYNLLDRRIERELLPMCRTYDIAVLPWSPIAGGLLSGKYQAGKPRPKSSRYSSRSAPLNRDNETAIKKAEEFTAFCKKRKVEPAGFAVAWVAAQAGVTSPIIGPRTMEQLDTYLESAEIEITPEDREAMDALFPPGTHLSEYYNADFGPNARWI